MATVDDGRQKDAEVILNFDSGPAKLAGWAAPREANQADDDLNIGLMVGSVYLGSIRRDCPRPDVDAHLGYSGPPCGFAVPDHGLAAFARICGLQDIGLTTVLSGGQSARYPLPDLGPRSTAAAPLGVRHGIGKIVRLVDIWLEGSRNFNLRFESSSRSAKTVDGYQCAPGGKLVNVAADRSIAGPTSLAGITLLNAFAPLLLVFKGQDGSIDAIDFLPFPSLVRGGMHAAERMIAAHGGDELADTATVSANLLDAWMQRIERPELGVTTIELDSSVHTGIEPILNDDLLGWLGDTLGIVVQRARLTDAPDQLDFIDQAIARHCPAKNPSGHTLHVPGDSIPTIAALVRPLPAGARSQAVTGGMGIVDWNRNGRVWSVWQPPFGKGFEALQLAGAHRFAPLLTIGDDGGSDASKSEIAIGWPLALVHRQQPTRIADNSPFETAPEVDRPVLGNGSQPKGRSASVLVLFDRQQVSPIPLLESLSRQDGVDINKVVICRPQGEKNARLAASAGRLFGDRQVVIPQPASAGRLEQIKSTFDHLDDEVVVIIDAATLLPDPRTISTLASMLAIPDVASAGCLIRYADEKMGPISAGYSLSQINLLCAPAVSFDPIDPTVWRGPSTYPVVANSLAALAVNREFLRKISAEGSTSFRPEVDDLQFGIQMIQSGGVNLCTTIVSAYSATGKVRSQTAISVPYRLSSQSLLRITESSTLIQRIS